jgi:hypothetical protein
MPTTSRVVLAALVFFVGFYAMLKVVWRFAARLSALSFEDEFKVEWFFAAVLVALAIAVGTVFSGLRILMGVWPWQ